MKKFGLIIFSTLVSVALLVGYGFSVSHASVFEYSTKCRYGQR